MNLDNVLKKVSQWGAALILLAPILVNGNFLFPFIHLKNLSFRLLVSALFVLLVWYAFRTGVLRGKKNYVLYALIFLWLAFLLATIFGIDPYNSFWGNYERMDGLLHLGLLVIYFLILINVFRTREDWVLILRVSILGAVLVSLYGVLQTFGVENSLILKSTSPRISATIGNPAFLASYLMFNLFFAALLWLWDKVAQWRVLYALSAVLFLFMIYHTGTRGPILGLIAGFFVMGIFYSWRGTRRGRSLVAAGFLLIIIFGSFIYSQRNSDWLKKYHAFYRLAQISLTDSTTKDRLLTWQTSWRAYQDRPLFGYGPENYRYGFNKYYNPNLEEQWFDRAHNVIFDYLNSAGILGLLGYLIVLGAAVYYIWSFRDRDFFASLLLLGLLVAYFFQNLFVFDTLNTFLPLMVTLALASSFSKDEDDDAWELPRSSLAFGPVVVSVLLLIVIIFDYQAFILPARANVTAIEAYKSSVVNPAKSLEIFKRALDYHTFGDREISLQLNNFALNVIRNPQQPQSLKDQVFAESDKRLTALLEHSPHDIQLRMMLAGLYQVYASFDRSYAAKSIDILEPYIEDSPKRLELYYTLAQGYLLQGNQAKATEYLQHAFDITGEKKSVYVNLMNVYSQVKDIAKLDELASEMLSKFDLNADDYNKLARFYYLAGALNKSVSMVDQAIQLQPGNFKYWQLKVSLLRDMKKYDEAIAILEDLSSQNPAWSQTINSYLMQLKKEQADLAAQSGE